MNKAEMHRKASQKFLGIPNAVLDECCQIFDENLGVEFMRNAKAEIRAKGMNNWMPDHSTFANVNVKELLIENGVYDEKFEDGTLEDYIIVLLEFWLGYREGLLLIQEKNIKEGSLLMQGKNL